MLATDKMSVVQEDDVPRPTCRLKPKSVLPHVRRTSCPSSARSGIRHRVAIAVRSPGRRLRLGGKRGRRCRRCRVGFDRGEPPHVRRTSCPSTAPSSTPSPAPSPALRPRFEQRVNTDSTCSRRTRCPSYKRTMHHDRPADSCRHPFSPCTTDILSVARSVVCSVARSVARSIVRWGRLASRRKPAGRRRRRIRQSANPRPSPSNWGLPPVAACRRSRTARLSCRYAPFTFVSLRLGFPSFGLDFHSQVVLAVLPFGRFAERWRKPAGCGRRGCRGTSRPRGTRDGSLQPITV
jgi:hypothetical protein